MPQTFGLPSLDAAVGRLEGIIEVVGSESSGKTTLAYHLLRRGGMLVTSEYDFDPSLLPGMDRARLVVVRPSFGEAGLEAASLALPGAVVIDSASALQPLISLNKKMWEEDAQGCRSYMLAFGARLLGERCSKYGGAVLFTQQLRSSLGYRVSGYERIPYGRGIEDLASIRIEMKRGSFIHSGHRLIGANVEANILKSPTGRKGGVVKLDLIYGKGFSTSASLLDLAIERGIIKRYGNWYRLDRRMLGNGREQACRQIEEEDLWQIIVDRLRDTARR